MPCSPNDFFVENGGRHLFQMNNDQREPSIEAYLRKKWTSWPKKDGTQPNPKSKTAGMSKPGGMATALIVVWQGGMILRTITNLRVPAFVSSNRASGLSAYYRLAAGPLMDLPRPLLAFTVGKSPDAALRNLRLTIDPDLVEVCGSDPFSIHRNDVPSILNFCETFGIEPKMAADFKASLEATLASDGRSILTRQEVRMSGKAKMITRLHTNHPKMIKLAREVAELPAKPSEDPDILKEEIEDLGAFWSAVDTLPMRTSPAWPIAIYPEEKASQ